MIAKISEVGAMSPNDAEITEYKAEVCHLAAAVPRDWPEDDGQARTNLMNFDEKLISATLLGGLSLTALLLIFGGMEPENTLLQKKTLPIGIAAWLAYVGIVSLLRKFKRRQVGRGSKFLAITLWFSGLLFVICSTPLGNILNQKLDSSSLLRRDSLILTNTVDLLDSDLYKVEATAFPGSKHRTLSIIMSAREAELLIPNESKIIILYKNGFLGIPWFHSYKLKSKTAGAR
jgi:hypothetical protein